MFKTDAITVTHKHEGGRASTAYYVEYKDADGNTQESALKSDSAHQVGDKVEAYLVENMPKTIYEKLKTENTVKLAVFTGIFPASGIALLIYGMKNVRAYKNAFENNPFKDTL